MAVPGGTLLAERRLVKKLPIGPVALIPLGLLVAIACGGSVSVNGQAGGSAGGALVGGDAAPRCSSQFCFGGSGGFSGATGQTGAAVAGSIGECAACPIVICGPGSTPVTKSAECCPSTCNLVTSGPEDGGIDTQPSLCELDLQEFENNGLLTCDPNDDAEVAGVCGARYQFDFGTRGLCGGFRVYGSGHDGRIDCAYDPSTGQLVGGYLSGVPVSALGCVQYFAGPAVLASCAPPITPFCRDGGSIQGGAGGGDAGQGGAAGELGSGGESGAN